MAKSKRFPVKNSIWKKGSEKRQVLDIKTNKMFNFFGLEPSVLEGRFVMWMSLPEKDCHWECLKDWNEWATEAKLVK